MLTSPLYAQRLIVPCLLALALICTLPTISGAQTPPVTPFTTRVVPTVAPAPAAPSSGVPAASVPSQSPAVAGSQTPPAAADTTPPSPPPVPVPALPLPSMEDVVAPVEAAGHTLEALEQQYERVKTSDTDLSQTRGEVEQLAAQVDKAADALRPRIDQTSVQIEKLGPLPKPPQPAEAAPIAAERARLATIASTLQGALKGTELIKVRLAQLTTRIQETRTSLFTRNLFQRSSSPLMPAMWRQIADEFVQAERSFQAVFGTWWGIIEGQSARAIPLAAGTIALFFVLWLAIRRPLAKLMPADIANPTFTQRVGAATLAAPLYALPGAAAAALAYYSAGPAGLIYSRVEALMEEIFQGVIIIVVVSALSRAILEPRRPQWRLIDVADSAARSLLVSTLASAVVYEIDQVLREVIRLLVLPLSFNVALSFITSLAFATLLLKMVATRFKGAPGSTAMTTSGDRATMRLHRQPILHLP